MAESSQGITYTGPLTLSVDTLPELLAKIDNPPDMVALDTETISIKDRTCIGIGIAFSQTEAIYFEILPDRSPYISHLVNIVCNRSVLKVYHNALFDLDVLSSYADIIGWWPPIDTFNIGDSAILARLLAMPATLEYLARTILDITIAPYKEVVPSGHNSLDMAPGIMAQKCLDDCMATYGIWKPLLKELSVG